MKVNKIWSIKYFSLTLCEIQIYIGMQQKQLNRLKVVLNEQGRTSIWLSKQLGKDPSTVSLWCTNKVQPSLEMIDKIAQLIGVDRVELINRSR
ncbi:MAG: helix-turn-helix transcriptional regulator [Rikenellaceae bacterium]